MWTFLPILISPISSNERKIPPSDQGIFQEDPLSGKLTSRLREHSGESPRSRIRWLHASRDDISEGSLLLSIKPFFFDFPIRHQPHQPHQPSLAKISFC